MLCPAINIVISFLGKFEEAVLHLANAAVVCSQKSEFLGVMQKTLPPQVFQLLIQYYQIANEVITEFVCGQIQFWPWIYFFPYQKYIKKVLQDQAMSNLSKISSGSKQQFIDDTDIEWTPIELHLAI